MAQSSWPFENIDTNETQFSQWARNIGEGVKTGALNELEVFADSTGMQVKARSGQALVRGHYYQNTAEVALSLEAADLTNPRVDTVVLELDPSANSIELKIVTGTPDPSPTAEPVVQTDAGIYQIKLADIAVAANATTIAAGNVTDTRFYIEDFNGTVPGSAITGEITTATMDGDRLFNAIDSATIPAANVTGLDVSAVSGLQTELDDKQDDVITTQGDLVIGDASGDPVRLGIGTADQVLTSDGTTMTWEDAAGGGGIYANLIASGSIGGNFSITSIPDTYKDLRLVIKNLDVNDGNPFLRINNDLDSNYFYVGIKASSASIQGDVEHNNFPIAFSVTSSGYCVIDIFGYQGNTGYKTLNAFSANADPTASSNESSIVTGGYTSSSDITEIAVFGGLDDGSYELYGVN